MKYAITKIVIILIIIIKHSHDHISYCSFVLIFSFVMVVIYIILMCKRILLLCFDYFIKKIMHIQSKLHNIYILFRIKKDDKRCICFFLLEISTLFGLVDRFTNINYSSAPRQKFMIPSLHWANKNHMFHFFFSSLDTPSIVI